MEITYVHALNSPAYLFLHDNYNHHLASTKRCIQLPNIHSRDREGPYLGIFPQSPQGHIQSLGVNLSWKYCTHNHGPASISIQSLHNSLLARVSILQNSSAVKQTTIPLQCAKCKKICIHNQCCPLLVQSYWTCGQHHPDFWYQRNFWSSSFIKTTH